MKVDKMGCVWYNQAEYVRKCIEKLEIQNKLKKVKWIATETLEQTLNPFEALELILKEIG